MKKVSPFSTSNRVSPSAAWLDDLVTSIIRDESYYMDSSFFSKTEYGDGFMRSAPANRTYYIAPALLGKIDNFTLAKSAHDDWKKLRQEIETLPEAMKKQLKPAQMYEDPQRLYANHMRSIFKKYLLENVVGREQCMGTYDVLVDFLRNTRGPVFFSQFLNSNLCPRTCSGFVIEMHAGPKDNLHEWYGVAQEWSRENTLKYLKMCKNNNFSLERESLLVLMHNSCPSYWGRSYNTPNPFKLEIRENTILASEVELEMFKMYFADFYVEYTKFKGMPQISASDVMASIPNKYWQYEWVMYSVPGMSEASARNIIKSPTISAFKVDHKITE